MNHIVILFSFCFLAVYGFIIFVYVFVCPGVKIDSWIKSANEDHGVD